MSESTKRHEENSNLIKEIRASTDAAIRNQGASIKTLEIQIGQMSKSISTTIEADSCPIRRIRSSQYAVSTAQNRTLISQFSEAYSEASHINNSIPRKEKDPGSFTLPCFINNVCFDNALVDLGTSVSVMPLSTYLNLGLGKLALAKLTVELIDRTMKYPKGIAENVLVGIGKCTFPIDFIILDILDDMKVPLIIGRPFLSTARAKNDVYKRKITLRVGEERIVFTSVKPASSLIKRVYMLSLRERMELYLEARLMGETLLKRNQSDDLMPTIEEDELIEEFRTRDDELDAEIDDYPSHYKMVYKGNNVVGALMNVPIFVGTFSVVTDFAVLENMDDYRDEEMGDVIFGESFLTEVRIKTRRFEGMITIYNGNDEVSEEDKMNEIPHPNQKLKGFYKGVLNLGPNYIRDAKMTLEAKKSTKLVKYQSYRVLCVIVDMLAFRRIYNTILLINSTWRIYRANIKGVSHSNSS
ncbi:hypothetical protein Tco_1278032 [Tanacetum coccineum]